jgi:hypothetical protein
MLYNKRLRSNSRIQLINNSPQLTSRNLVDIPNLSLDIYSNKENNKINWKKYALSLNLLESNYYSFMLIIFIYYCFGFFYNAPAIHYFEIQHQLFFISTSYYYLSNGYKINKKYWNPINLLFQASGYLTIEYFVSISLFSNIIITEDYIEDWNLYEWLFILATVIFIYIPIIFYFAYQAYLIKQMLLYFLSPIVFISYILFSKYILLDESYTIHIHHYIIAYLIGINARYNTFISRSIHSFCLGIMLQGIIKYNADLIFE